MVDTSEIVRRSPIRILDAAIHGGLKAGEMGVIAAPSGIGKTSVLVQLGMDKLLREKKVIHVSFTQDADYVLVWYQDIFNELFKKESLRNPKEVKRELEKNRVQMKFTQEGLTVDQILKSIRALIKEGGFKADAVIVDGLKFAKIKEEHVAAFKAFAAEMAVCIWFSCTVKGEEPLYDKQRIPLIIKEYAKIFEVIVVLQPKPDGITLTVSRDRDEHIPEDLALRLDPKTLLILEN